MREEEMKKEIIIFDGPDVELILGCKTIEEAKEFFKKSEEEASGEVCDYVDEVSPIFVRIETDEEDTYKEKVYSWSPTEYTKCEHCKQRVHYSIKAFIYRY